MHQKILLNNKSVMLLGMHEELIDTYYQIFQLVNEEQTGFIEISYGFDFQSIHYFSRLFRNKMAQNPTQVRQIKYDFAVVDIVKAIIPVG